jgi:beta-mannosidase
MQKERFGVKQFDLAGKWTLSRWREKGKTPQTGISIRIPGDTYCALIEAGEIPDPYVGTNELAAAWVGQTDWRLSRIVTLDRDFLENHHVLLHLDSVDTFAELRINGELVAQTGNMFTPLRIDVGVYLKVGENLFEILLYSAEKRATELSETLPYVVPYSSYPVQSPHRNLVRKVQCHSGWDWGPCLMVSGIYGRTYLSSYRHGRIDSVTTDQVRKNETWELTVTVEYFASTSEKIPIEVAIPGKKVEDQVAVEPGLNTLRKVLEIPNPDLWWPRGYGRQRLYVLSVKAGADRAEKRIGFRTVELHQEDDESGRSMVIAVNGRRIFCKGANWIPCDALPGRQSAERYKALLSDAAAANMNMLRVWGGGQYETELFYELCDEMGLLIWQDFMFSCALYPAQPWFLEQVEAEVRYQVKRLKHHPCIAVWCGNNENLGALKWYPESRAHSARYLVDYDRLNEGVVGRIVRELDTSRPWWPSSPSAGVGDYSDNWHEDSKGDMHYWSVWHEGRNFEAYYEVTPRFCSEFGFQSFPSKETVRTYAPEDQWNITSQVMEHHQRNPRGNTIIVETMTRYFRLPEGFDNFLYLSQVQQALAMKTAVEYWRSRRPVCMGALYWQLNDVWPAASWSSIEYSGKWKLLHYAARKFYAPLHIVAFSADGRSVQIVGLNDTLEYRAGTVWVGIIDFAGRIRQEQELQVRLDAEAATDLLRYPLDQLPLEKEQLFLFVEFRPRIDGGGRQEQPLVNELFLCPPKHCGLNTPEIRTEIGLKDDRIVIKLGTNRPAFFVSLEVEGVSGVFSDNLFTLLPGKPKLVDFEPRDATAGDVLDLLNRKLKIFHLRGTYR